MYSKVDLLRLNLQVGGTTVEAHTTDRLCLATEKWLLFAYSVDSERAGNIQRALEGVARRSRECREDHLNGPNGLKAYRLMKGAAGERTAAQVDYLVYFPGACIVVGASSRSPGERWDVSPVDALVLALRLADDPRQDAEVAPPWVRYQRSLKPGSPVGKFVLYMDPAPVRLGNRHTGLRDGTIFTDNDFRRGGRQVARDLIEFYVRDDPHVIRVDLWLESQPDTEGRERIFEATLHVEQPRTSLWSFDEAQDVEVPPGSYEVTVTRVHHGLYSERSLTETEWFGRDDLERYEILLVRRDPGPK